MISVSLQDGRYYVCSKSARRWCFLKNGQEISGNYITYKDLQRNHPDGAYTIVGEVLQSADVEKQKVKSIETDDGISLTVNPVGIFSAKSHKNIGYIPCGQNKYIGFYKKKATGLILPLILLPLLVLSVLLAMWYRSHQPEPEIQVPSIKYEIDSSITNYEGQLKRPADMDQTQILIPGFSALYVKEGSDMVNSCLFNPADNPCFFQFNVVDTTTGEILYESKLVPPGKGIEGFKLNRTYEAGEYPAVIQFKSHDLEDPSINYNGSEMEITLVVAK